MKHIIYNAVRLPSGKVLESRHQHDYNCAEGVCVDGGLDYLRRVGNLENCTELSVCAEDPIEKTREVPLWGTYGKSGKDKFKWVCTREMETDHISNILQYQFHVNAGVRQALIKELLLRDELKEVRHKDV